MGVGLAGGMEESQAAAGGDVCLHNFSARLWEQLVHFHVMRLTDSLFLWVGATPHLRNLAVAMCSRYVSAGGGPGPGSPAGPGLAGLGRGLVNEGTWAGRRTGEGTWRGPGRSWAKGCHQMGAGRGTG